MLTRFLNNWPYKLAAIAIAVVLRLYVNSLVNPHTVRDLPDTPLTVKNVPAGYVVTDIPKTVTVRVSGPASTLDKLGQEGRISATADLRGAHSGVNPNLPVTVSLPPDASDQVSVDWVSPATISTTLDMVETLHMRVQVSFGRLPPAGYIYKQPVISPAIVTVTGPAPQLGQVREVVAYAEAQDDTGAPVSTMEGTFSLIPLDDHGAQVAGVVVSPQMAHVVVPVVRIAAAIASPKSGQSVAHPVPAHGAGH